MRPRLLFLGSTLPYPPDTGMTIRSYHVLRLLAGEFDVTALCLYRRTLFDASQSGGKLIEPELARRIAALRPVAEVEAFPIPQEHHVGRLAWDHLRSVGLHRVYTAFTYDSPSLTRRLVHLLRTRRFDAIHVDAIQLSGYLRLLGCTPVVCTHHNVESTLLRRRRERERSPWRRAYLLYQAHLMEREVRRWCGRCRLNVAVSEEDRAELLRLAPDARFAVVPNGVDVEGFRPGGDQETGIVFAGGLTWVPNRDALEFFCDAILPGIRAATGEQVSVRWVGGGVSDQMRRHYREHHAVELTGYVPDVRRYVRAAACYVVPLRVGGGTRLKILEAWAMGKAVVSTSIGCEGLAAEDGRNILIRDDPRSFGQAVCAVLRDGSLRRRLGAEGRRTVERQYSWERIGQSMMTLYRSLLRPEVDQRAAAVAE